MNEEMCEEMRRRGFCLVPLAASPHLLALMQQECDALVNITDLDERDCVVDIWEELAIDDRHPARLQKAGEEVERGRSTCRRGGGRSGAQKEEKRRPDLRRS
eukprot:766122-Hanusia_phi.AAC.2